MLLQRLNAHVHEHESPSYFINLDPAVHALPYGANIDIRDTVNYKEVMKQYGSFRCEALRLNDKSSPL